MTSAHRDGQATATGDAYRALLAVSEAINSNRELTARFHEQAGLLGQGERANSGLGVRSRTVPPPIKQEGTTQVAFYQADVPKTKVHLELGISSAKWR